MAQRATTRDRRRRRSPRQETIGGSRARLTSFAIPSAPPPFDGEAPQKNPQTLSRRPRADALNILTKGVPQANAPIRVFRLFPFENFSRAHARAFGASAPKAKRSGNPSPPRRWSPARPIGRETRQSRRQRSPRPPVARGPSTRPPSQRDRETASEPRPSPVAWQDRRQRDRAPSPRRARGPERRSPPPAPAKARRRR